MMLLENMVARELQIKDFLLFHFVAPKKVKHDVHDIPVAGIKLKQMFSFQVLLDFDCSFFLSPRIVDPPRISDDSKEFAEDLRENAKRDFL